MRKDELEIIRLRLINIDRNKYDLYSKLGFSTIQIKELFEYDDFKVQCCIRAGNITTDMNLSQIREIMHGIYSNNFLDIYVFIYAKSKYNHNFMRIIRILLEWGIDPHLINTLLNEGEFTIKEFFILTLITAIDKQDIDMNIRFVKKCTDQVQDLYKAYRPIFSNIKRKNTLDQILNAFDHDVYLAKIEYLATHDDKRI